MWVVRKKSPDTNYKFQTIYRSPNKEDAKGVYLAELRLLFESNPNLERKQIDQRVQSASYTYGVYNESGDGTTRFRFFESFAAAECVPLTRPSRTDILNQILESKTLCSRPD